MSKKRIAVLTAMILGFLCGCGKKINVEPSHQNLPASTEEQNLPSADKTDVLPPGDNPDTSEENSAKDDSAASVCDRWADSGAVNVRISEDEYYGFDYDYRIPMIVDDTDGADEINDAVAGLFEEIHDTMQTASKEGIISAEEFNKIVWREINYECYRNGSIASIVICSTAYYDSSVQYNVFNYDFASGKKLSNEDLFAHKGMSGEKFVQDIRRAAVYALDAEVQPVFKQKMPLIEADGLWYADVADDDVQQLYGDFLTARAKTIYSDNINEYIPVFLDEQGELQAVVHLYNIGMNGDASIIMSPKAWVNNGANAYCGDLLSVLSKDDGMYLIIYREEWSADVREEYPTFDFATEYKINGLNKNYTETKFSWVGNGRQPYILLLSDDGTVAYVDIWQGIVSEYFCAVEPLWGLEGLLSFSDDFENRIAAVNSEGKSVDAEDALFMMLNCRYAGFEKNMLSSDKVLDYLSVDNLTFNGMNEHGLIFCFSAAGEEGESRGTMVLNDYSF